MKSRSTPPPRKGEGGNSIVLEDLGEPTYTTWALEFMAALERAKAEKAAAVQPPADPPATPSTPPSDPS